MADSLIRCRCGRALSWERLSIGYRHEDGTRCEPCVAERFVREFAIPTLGLEGEEADAFAAKMLAWIKDAPRLDAPPAAR